MTLVRESVRDAAVGVGVADTPEGLSALGQAGCAAVIWRRQPLARFQDWIDTVDPEQLPKARVILRPDDVRTAVTQICVASGMPDCRERAWFIDDVAAMADIFSGLMHALYLRLRLDVVTTNACRKFHMDVVTARLICTYRGTGTQYGIAPDGDDPLQVFTVPTGAPIVLRGMLWDDDSRPDLLHRSPPIDGTGETRLLLVLDAVNDPEDEI